MKQNREEKLIYISGYGRSGSTILEIYMAEHLCVFPTGELTNLFHFYSNNKFCACGKRIQFCSFWNNLFMSFGKKNFKELNLNTKLAESPIISFYYKSRWKNTWHTVMTLLFEKIKTNAIIDSSKSTRDTFNRLKLLRSFDKYQVCEILLIRNPEEVMKSAKKGSNKNLETDSSKPVLAGGAIRAGFSWLLTNFFAIYRFKRDEGILVSYEQFGKSPQKTLLKIKHKFNLKTNNLFQIRHGISGNRLRRSNKKLKIEKRTSQIDLNRIERLLAKILKIFYRAFLKQLN